MHEDNEIDFRQLFWQFIIRLSLVFLMVIILYLCGNVEIVRWFTSYETRDFGSFLCLMGILMFVACFFDTTQPFLTVKPFNLICAGTIWLFGNTLTEKGIMSAIFALGILAFVIAYLSAPLSLKIASISLIVGLCAIFISWMPFPNCPTKIPAQIHKPINIETEWHVYVGDDNYNVTELSSYESADMIRDLKHPISDLTPYIKGTEEDITRKAGALLKKYIESNPNKKIDFIKIKSGDLPRSYTDLYGFPEVYFDYKYINKNGLIEIANNH